MRSPRNVFIFITCVLLVIGILVVGLSPSETSHEIVVELQIPGINDIRWSPDSSRLAISNGPDIQIWDTGTWEQILTISDTYIYDFGWSPDGSRIAGLRGGREERLLVWNSETGDILQQIARQLPDDMAGIGVLQSLAWNPGGTQVVSDGVFDVIVVWDLEAETSTTLVPGQTSHAFTEILWSESGRYFLSGGLDRTLRVWDTATGENILSVPGYKYVAWHPDETYFAGAGLGNVVNVWSLGTGELETQFLGPTNTITSVDWSVDGRTISSTDADGNLFLWDFLTGKQIQLDFLGDIHIGDARWRPDTTQFAIKTLDNVLIVSW